MIKVDTLLYKIDQRLNKLSSNDDQQVPLEDKILALNEAQIKLIKQKLSGNSVANQLGLDAYKKRYEDLENLIVGYKEFPLILTNQTINQWSVNLKELVPDYLFYINSFALANKDVCKDKIIWINSDLSKHGDLSLLLNNEHYKPNFEYEETFNLINDKFFQIYTDGSFEFTKLNLMYIKKPAYINKIGYVMIDGTSSVNKDCELKDYLEDELLDLTVQNLGMFTENQSAVQNSQYRILTNE